MIIKHTPVIAKFVPGEFFVVRNISLPGNSYLYKIGGVGGTGMNMFLGGTNVLGSQHFSGQITAMDYANGFLLIGFKDRRFAKIKGTGGTGTNMFNITKASNGFQTANPSYSTYLAGSHRFNHHIVEIACIGGETIVCFNKPLIGKAKILKVAGTGGTGHNPFAITETSSSFSGISGYNYYLGDQAMKSEVTDLTRVGTHTFFSFRNGRMAKIDQTGGTGHNMLAIKAETNSGFTSVAGYNYLVGSAKFQSYVTKGLDRTTPGGGGPPSVSFFSLQDGRIMKIAGSGGTGQNMFNIQETSGGFQTSSSSYTAYLVGSHRFSTHVTDMKFFDTLFLGLDDGFVLKIDGVGGSGLNMFNIAFVSNGYQTASSSYAAYLIGSQDMRGSHNARVTHLANFDNRTFVGFLRPSGQQQKHIKVLGTGLPPLAAPPNNMFGLQATSDGCFTGLSPSALTTIEGCQIY